MTPGELTSLKTKHVSSTRESITRAGLDSCGARLVPAETLLVTSRATLGSVALAGVELCTNQGFKSVQFVGATSPDFYYHLLKTLTGELERRASGTTFLEVSGHEFAAVVVPKPPLPEQRQIAAILDTLDDAIRKTEQIIAKLKQVKQGLLHDLLTRGIDDNGELRDPERHPEQFMDSALGRIPKAWEVASVRRVTTLLTYGFTNPMPTVDEGPWMLTAADIADGTVRWGGARRTSRAAFTSLLTAKSRPLPGDLLLTKDGTLGRMAMLDRHDVCINQSVALLRCSEGWLRDLLFTYLRSPPGQERMLADAGGSTIKHIYISKLGDMTVPKPARQESEAIAAVVGAAEERLALDESALAKLRLLKAGLMEDLLTGRVRVTPLLENVSP